MDASGLVPLTLDQPSVSLPDFSLYSGVIITGSPYNFLSTEKTDAQRWTEEHLLRLCERLLAADFPTLALCFGLQMLAVAAGGTLTSAHPENMGAYPITLTEEGKKDPLTGQLPPSFYNYVAHAESLADIPDGLTVLASSPTTPVHLGRFGQNIYGTQHHPEIDTYGIRLRIEHYVGVYFDPAEYEDILSACTSVHTEHGLIPAFTQRYQR
nr:MULTISPECIES: gamma-glutamyl-gamma-aminobutyrate hydrolase family protein [unclassified Schaalia]